MRLSLRSGAMLALCLLFSLPNATAWNSIGHMAVAYAAYQQLTPGQKARVAALLALNPNYQTKWMTYIKPGTSAADRDMYIFMMAATWPDEIKAMNSGYKNDGNVPPKSAEAEANTGYTDLYMHKYWHFVDVPFSTDGSALPAIPAPNAETEIEVMRKGLASDEPDALKSYDLVWLMHLTGDVHQPLHCATRVTAASKRGDAGGNAVTLSGNPNELHAYWDDLLGSGQTQDFLVAVKAAAALPAPDAKAAADLDDADWVKESADLAPTNVYVDPPIGPGNGPFTIAANSDYATKSLATAQARVALAGARLAAVLNAELK